MIFDNQPLFGTKKLVGGNTYNFVVPTPNPLIQEVLCDVYLECDSTLGAITINLPSIAAGASNARIFISDVAAIAATNNIIVAADTVLPELINALPSVSIITNGGAVIVSSVNNAAWLAVGTF